MCKMVVRRTKLEIFSRKQNRVYAVELTLTCVDRRLLLGSQNGIPECMTLLIEASNERTVISARG